MNNQLVIVKLTQDSSELSGNFHMNQKKNAFLYLIWAVLVLSVMILPTVSYANDGDDLVQAASTGNLSTVQALLAKGTKIDYQNKNGYTALMQAFRNGHVKGAKVNHLSKSGATALIVASLNGHVKVVRELLTKGAKVNHQTKDGGLTALIVASMNGHVKVVRELLTKGAKVNHQSKILGYTALMAAKTQEIKKLLKEYGARE